eukprot:s1712_g9.t1
MFMRPFTFHIGGTPITVTPGMSVNMKIFHIGQMKGTIRVGLKTIINCTGSMHFDTTFGEQHNFSTEMLNVSFTSPTWLLFTRRFQLGVELAPNAMASIAGGMGILRDMEMGFGLRPYFNVSVHEEQYGSMTNELAIYPYRVMGLPYGRRAGGRYKETAIQMSTGVVEFQNKVEIFEFPPMTEQQLLSEQIQVDILEDGQDPAKATGTVVCRKVTMGMCEPHPTQVKLSLDGEDLAEKLRALSDCSRLVKSTLKYRSCQLWGAVVTSLPRNSSYYSAMLRCSHAEAGCFGSFTVAGLWLRYDQHSSGGLDILVHLGIFFQGNALGSLVANMQSISLRTPMVTFNPTGAGPIKAFLKEAGLFGFDMQPKPRPWLHETGYAYYAWFPGETSLWKADTIWELGPTFPEFWESPPITTPNLTTNERRLQNLVQIASLSGPRGRREQESSHFFPLLPKCHLETQ